MTAIELALSAGRPRGPTGASLLSCTPSLLIFQPDYLTRLIEIGEADAEARAHDAQALLDASRWDTPVPQRPVRTSERGWPPRM